jgi:hypothetical protein
MLFIHIKSLPFEKTIEIKAVLEGYARRGSARISLMKPKSPSNMLQPRGNFSCQVIMQLQGKGKNNNPGRHIRFWLIY